jgi:hypothetical protein
MPRTRAGQQITFAIEADEDQRIKHWIWIHVVKGDTVAKIAASRGHPEDVKAILKENGIRNANSHFSGHPRKGAPKGHEHQIKVPGALRKSLSFNVLAGNDGPKIVSGYAKFSILARPERTGLTVFDGYDPIVMEVPIRFEARRSAGEAEGNQIERDIELLERMAGRGAFEGASVGPPPVIRVSVTDGDSVIPLIPRNYQWSKANPQGPLWRVADLDLPNKTGDERLVNDHGNRVRQLGTVTLQQHIPLSLVSRSVTVRAKAKPKKKK